ncbi:MAG TPA: hypothetical protein DHV55_13550 [Clostridiaceae bacterium]|nr:hypothetical protein [Clostridiaceae bacterium]
MWNCPFCRVCLWCYYYNLRHGLMKVYRKEFTLDELAMYDGSGGRPAYVAVNSIVYDVSNNAFWGGGTHFGLYAGKDLTSQFLSCHGSLEILNVLPKVGIIKA